MEIKEKGISHFISYVFFIAMIFSGITVVLMVGVPIMDKTSDTQAISQAQDFLSGLDDEIKSLSAQGKGTQTEINFELDRGAYYCNETENSFYYQIETESKAISVNASRSIGNLFINASSGEKRTVKISLSYDNINITKCDHFGPGMHTVLVKNLGVHEGTRMIKLERG